MVHGGAGHVARDRMEPGGAERVREGLRAALARGLALLEAGAPALDAVCEAVAELEARPEFNAGRGAVLARDGSVQLSASVMRGADRAAGAVAHVCDLLHPVRAARAVLADGRAVLLVGEAASALGRAAGVPPASPDELIIPRRRADLERALRDGGAELDLDADHGTVGAVACDARGRLAAATSTGGLTGQLPGRVGDSPLIGAGTWADDGSVAVSATGTGEVFIRAAFAHQVDALLRHAGLDLASACDRALEEVTRLGGRGGCVAVTPAGDIALPFTTRGMYRGWARAGEARHVALFAGDPG